MNEKYTEKIRQWCQERSYTDENLLVASLRGLTLDELTVYSIIMTISEHCSDCFDGPSNCQCENDE